MKELVEMISNSNSIRELLAEIMIMGIAILIRTTLTNKSKGNK